MIEIMFLLILTFALRLIPRYIFQLPINSDTWFHITYAEEISRNGKKVPSDFKKFLLNNEVVYPFFYHYLISFISFKNNIKLEKYYSAIIDTLFVLVSYIVIIHITQHEDIALISALLLAISPSLLKVSTGPRAYQGTPRVLGEFLVFCSILSFYFFWQDSNYLWFVLSVITGSLSLLSSKFSVQVLVLFLPTIALFINSIAPIILLIFMFIFAIIFSKDKYMTILIGHYNHLYNYATVIKKQWKEINELNQPKDYILFFKKVFSLKIVDALKILNGKLLYLNIIYKSPELYIFALYILYYGTTNEFDAFLLGWAFSGLIFFFIVSTYSFKFIGEAERYIEYSLFPIILFISLNSNENTLTSIILFFIALYSLNIYKIKRSASKNKNYEKHLIEASDFLKVSYDENNNLLPLISKTTFHQGAILTGMNILATTQYDRKKFGEDKWDKLYELGFPLFTNDFKWLEETYGINFILVYTPFIKKAQEESSFIYKFDGYKEVYNKNDFVVYEKIC